MRFIKYADFDQWGFGISFDFYLRDLDIQFGPFFLSVGF
jgi:hypothetical protein